MKRPIAAERRTVENATPAQLAWVAIAVLAGGAPHLLRVAPWISALLFATFSWRILAAVRNKRLPSLWLRVPLTFFAFAGVVASYRSVSGVEAGSALLLVMAAMKALETRSTRDRILLTLIGYFLLFAAFLREQALWSPLWLAAGTIAVTAALTQTARCGHLVAPLASLRLATRLLLQAAPLALILFVLFPRIPGPFWSLPKPGAATSGLSDEMEPGDITAISLSDEVAFRVRFSGEPPQASALYWRGPVLDRFDGRRWRAGTRPTRASATTGASGPVIDYEIVLEPHGQHWLLALETPAQWSMPRAWLTGQQQLIAADPTTERMSYRARSAIGATRADSLDVGSGSRAVQLPAGRNPRTLAFASRLREQADSDRDYLEQVLQHFRTEAFWYTPSPPALGAESVDEFLFETRQGFCEHYASAFATLARAAGIPARVVLGYQGAERNPLSDYWIVRQANAHAWTEVWLDSRWQRIDPTAVVAPERIDLGIERALAGTARFEDRLWRSSPALHRLALSWDAVNAAWDRWVLAFGPETQLELLLALGFEVPRPVQLAALAGSATALCLWLLAFALRPRAPAGDPAAVLYAELSRRLAAVVRPRAAAESPSRYASSIASARPDLADAVCAITGLYLRLRYEAPGDAQLRRQLAVMISRFRPSDAPAPG
jgi:transglutaminase-like putative cysteine protease